MTISVTVFEDADKWLRDNLGDMTWDSVAAVVPTDSPLNLGGENEYEDREDGTKKMCSWDDHLKALDLLAQKIGKTLFFGVLKSPTELADPCNWDVEVVDAFYQLVYRQDVIYG